MLVDERIEAFWEAWPDVRPLLEADLAAGEYGPGTQLLTDMVEALHSDLEWDIRPGLVAVNALCLTSGDHRLRPLTGRWVAVAPPADTQWEFHPARTPIGPEVFDIDDHEIDPSQATFVAEIDPDAEHLSITVAHPEFRSLDEANRFQATFRMIDDLLGEDGTEKWIGSVDATPGSLHQPAPLTDLPRVVDELAAAATGERWIVIEAEDPHDPSSLDINLALKRLDHLRLTDYFSANLRFEDEAGIAAPQPEEAAGIEALEEELQEALGDRGVEFARGLFPGVLVLHWYVDPEATPVAEDWAKRHQDVVYHYEVESDPGWDLMHELF